MRPEISELSGGNEWRIFTSLLDSNGSLNSTGFSKICNLLQQIFDKLFKFEYNVAENVSINDMSIYKNTRKYSFNSYLLHVDISNDTFCIGFDFDLTKIDDDYIFGDCKFELYSEFLLSKLPINPTKNRRISCISSFTLNQQYFSTDLKYSQLIVPYKAINNIDNTSCPTLRYSYLIKDDKTDLNIVFFYTNYKKIEGFGRDYDTYFSINQFNINTTMMKRVDQFFNMINFYSKVDEMNNIFPELIDSHLKSSIYVEKLLIAFLQSTKDETDKLLTLEMALI